MREIRIIEFDAPAISKKEILRYMGCKESSDEVDSLIDSAIDISIGGLSYKVAYTEFQVQHYKDELDLEFARCKSKDMIKALDGCRSIILFAATVGLNIDREILKYSHISPAISLCIQAIGAERIEALCDKFCQHIKSAYPMNDYKPRFSAGYGDIPLSLQKDIFRALSCEKNLGLTLNNSLMMSPTKSVTAIIGIKNSKDKNENT